MPNFSSENFSIGSYLELIQTGYSVPELDDVNKHHLLNKAQTCENITIILDALPDPSDRIEAVKHAVLTYAAPIILTMHLKYLVYRYVPVTHADFFQLQLHLFNLSKDVNEDIKSLLEFLSDPIVQINLLKEVIGYKINLLLITQWIKFIEDYIPNDKDRLDIILYNWPNSLAAHALKMDRLTCLFKILPDSYIQPLLQKFDSYLTVCYEIGCNSHDEAFLIRFFRALDDSILLAVLYEGRISHPDLYKKTMNIIRNYPLLRLELESRVLANLEAYFKTHGPASLMDFADALVPYVAASVVENLKEIIRALPEDKRALSGKSDGMLYQANALASPILEFFATNTLRRLSKSNLSELIIGVLYLPDYLLYRTFGLSKQRVARMLLVKYQDIKLVDVIEHILIKKGIAPAYFDSTCMKEQQSLLSRDPIILHLLKLDDGSLRFWIEKLTHLMSLENKEALINTWVNNDINPHYLLVTQSNLNETRLICQVLANPNTKNMKISAKLKKNQFSGISNNALDDLIVKLVTYASPFSNMPSYFRNPWKTSVIKKIIYNIFVEPKYQADFNKNELYALKDGSLGKAIEEWSKKFKANILDLQPNAPSSPIYLIPKSRGFWLL